MLPTEVLLLSFACVALLYVGNFIEQDRHDINKWKLMEPNELYPELIDYIFNYCGKYFWEKELKANHHLHAVSKSKNGGNIVMYKFLQQKGFISSESGVLDLVKDGFESYKIKVATRIYNEHTDELELNLCPKCGKVARTPEAQQCQFCFYSWRESVE